MNPKRYNVGDVVMITAKNLQTIRNSNRSIHAYPSDSFVEIASNLANNHIAGRVSETFLPGYEVNVTFVNGQILQMKDHWITELTYDSVAFIP